MILRANGCAGWSALADTAAGFSLIELLVAATCTALIAASVLSLMAGGAGAGHHLLAEAEIRGLARAATTMLGGDLERAGSGAEGARVLRRESEQIPIIEPIIGGLVRLMLPNAGPIEVEPITGSGRYLVNTVAGLGAGTQVAGLGRDPLLNHQAIAGIVRSALGGGRGPLSRTGVVEIVWAADTEQIGPGPAAEVRALLPFTWREYALAASDDGFQLRRRDDEGNWQPVVDHLSWLQIDYQVDTDGDGRPEGGLVPWPDAGARIVGARIRAEAVLRHYDPVIVERWVRVGG